MIFRCIQLLAVIATMAAALSGGAAQERRSIAPQSRDNPLKELISGYHFGALKTRSQQDDEFDNPGFPSLQQGEKLWKKVEGAQQKSCATCHADASQSMKGAAAAYPKFWPASNKVINLEQRINACRDEKMSAPRWEYESTDLIAMTSFVRNQSRGLAVNVVVDGPARPAFNLGKKEHETRIGQLNMSCADCHNVRYGQKLRAETISQGHSNGFPSYRLRDKTMNSLHDRFRRCNAMARAEPHESGSDEYVALELYLAWRGAGLPVETPAVRK